MKLLWLLFLYDFFPTILYADATNNGLTADHSVQANQNGYGYPSPEQRAQFSGYTDKIVYRQTSSHPAVLSTSQYQYLSPEQYAQILALQRQQLRQHPTPADWQTILHYTHLSGRKNLDQTISNNNNIPYGPITFIQKQEGNTIWSNRREQEQQRYEQFLRPFASQYGYGQQQQYQTTSSPASFVNSLTQTQPLLYGRETDSNMRYSLPEQREQQMLVANSAQHDGYGLNEVQMARPLNPQYQSSSARIVFPDHGPHNREYHPYSGGTNSVFHSYTKSFLFLSNFPIVTILSFLFFNIN